MNAAEKAEALASIRQDLGGLGLGLVLGAVACYFVRPKTKATNALEMAQRWLAWGLLGSVSSGVSFWVQNYDKGGIVGGLITILVFSGLAWGLGYAWGLLKFREKTSAGLTQGNKLAGSNAHGKGVNPGILGAAIVGLVVLGLVIVSGSKDTATNGQDEFVDASLIQEASDRALKEATEALEAQAERGHAFSQLIVGRGYLIGEGGRERDPGRAVTWLRKAAEQGESTAQVLLGECYIHGLGVKKDIEQAVELFEQAAKGGSADGAKRLSYLFTIKKDASKGLEWLRRAAELGDPESQLELGQMMLRGETVSAEINMNLSELKVEKTEGNDELAAAWISKAAEAGLADAQRLLGILYRRGEGVPKDAKTSFAWTRRAAEQGFAEAQYALGWRYIQGDGVDKDYQAAVKWQLAAAKQGYASAQCVLGALYGDGIGVTKDATTALAWFYNAKANGEGLTESEMAKVVKSIDELENAMGMDHAMRAQELAKNLVPTVKTATK